MSDLDDPALADLLELDPDRSDRSLPAVVARRLTGTFEIDEWGFDADLAAAASQVAALRWNAEVRAADRLPEIGPALVVHNCHPDPAASWLVAAALARAVGRPVRFLDRRTFGPFAAVVRRLGGVPACADDVRSLLRGGHIVVVGLRRSWRHPLATGHLDDAVLDAAIGAKAPVFPTRVSGPVLGRRRFVLLDEPISTRQRRRRDRVSDLGATVERRVERLGS